MTKKEIANYEIINEKLLAMNIDIESLPDHIIKHLIEIEFAIQKRNKDIAETIKKLKESNYGIIDIAKDINKSRTNFYKYDNILKKYVEYSIVISPEIDYINQEKIYKENLADLKDQILLMKNRDLKEMILQTENEELKLMITEKNAEIDRLQSRIIKLSEENMKRKLV